MPPLWCSPPSSPAQLCWSSRQEAPQMLGRRVRARGQARAAPALVRRRLPEWGRMRVAPALVPQRLPEWGRKTPPPAQIRAPTINRTIRTLNPPRRQSRGRPHRPQEMSGLVTRKMACRSGPLGRVQANEDQIIIGSLPSRNASAPAAQAKGNISGGHATNGPPVGTFGKGPSLSDQVSRPRAARAGDKVLDAKAQVERRTTVSPKRVPGITKRGL
ncbi:hypothetical protein ACVWZV_008445 [Bradyrhizobium sp. GM5.1]